MDGHLVDCLFLLGSSGREIENAHASRQLWEMADDVSKNIPPPSCDTTLVMKVFLLQVQPPEEGLVGDEVLRPCRRMQFVVSGVLPRSTDDHSVMRQRQG